VIFGLCLAREMGTEGFPMAFGTRWWMVRKKKDYMRGGKTKLRKKFFELKTL